MEKFETKIERNILENPQIKEIYNKLYLIKRTGWVDRKVKNPETVGEHTGALVDMVDRWVHQLSINDPEELKNILRVHDFPEIKDGDKVTAHLPDDEYSKAKEKKFKSEVNAMRELCEPLGEKGRELFDLWLTFERQSTHDASIGFQLDKIHPIIKAFEYESRGEQVSTREFIEYVERKKYVTHPFLLKQISDIKLKLEKIGK